MINAADDERNPPETGLMERVENACWRAAAPDPASDDTRDMARPAPSSTPRTEATAAGRRETLITDRVRRFDIGFMQPPSAALAGRRTVASGVCAMV